MLVEGSADVLGVASADFIRLYVSPSCPEVMGYDSEQLVGGSIYGLVHPDDLAMVNQVFRGLSAERPRDHVVWRMRRPEGHFQWMETQLRRLPNGHIVSSIRSVQQRKLSETSLEEALARVERLAMSDPLTDLANRRCFIESVERMLGDARPGVRHSLILLDLDRFKPINDIYGHAAGDDVLIQIARRLSQAAPPGTPLARLGGDEFAMLVEDTGAGDLDTIIQTLLRRVAEPIAHGGRLVDIATSIGVATAPVDGQDCGTLLRRADLAMYEAKQGGDGGYRHFTADMEERLMRATELRSALPAALQTRQIIPHYQPIVSLDDDRLIAFEALARWDHPAHGLLPPDQFIPASQEMGLEAELLEAMLEGACRDAATWPPAIRLHVNISPTLLADADLPRRIGDLLAAAGFAPSRLVLEVIETLPTNDTAMAASVLAQLQAEGIRVVLDDFGIGHSGLHTLQQLQFDGFKIDRSFVEPVATDDAAERYLGAILEFARALELEVTAEGIETQAVATRLRAMGFTQGQGYLFSRPIEAAQVSAMIEASLSSHLGTDGVPSSEAAFST